MIIRCSKIGEPFALGVSEKSWRDINHVSPDWQVYAVSCRICPMLPSLRRWQECVFLGFFVRILISSFMAARVKVSYKRPLNPSRCGVACLRSLHTFLKQTLAQGNRRALAHHGNRGLGSFCLPCFRLNADLMDKTCAVPICGESKLYWTWKEYFSPV